MDPFMPQVGESSGVFKFTIPVMQDYGIGNSLYFDPVFASGYEYRVDGSRFASFTMPGALPGGDDLFQLEFNGVFYDLMAGNVFDFTSIDPLGASQFFLRGIDPSEMMIAFDLPNFANLTLCILVANMATERITRIGGIHDHATCAQDFRCLTNQARLRIFREQGRRHPRHRRARRQWRGADAARGGEALRCRVDRTPAADPRRRALDGGDAVDLHPRPHGYIASG